jgi:hypothetical protein
MRLFRQDAFLILFAETPNDGFEIANLWAEERKTEGAKVLSTDPLYLALPLDSSGTSSQQHVTEAVRAWRDSGALG